MVTLDEFVTIKQAVKFLGIPRPTREGIGTPRRIGCFESGVLGKDHAW